VESKTEKSTRLKKSLRNDIRKDIRDRHFPGSAGLQKFAKLSLRDREAALKAEGGSRNYAQAIARNVRQSPQKIRLVVDLIRGKKLEEARAILKYTQHRSAEVVVKVLESAIANAINNYDLIEDELVVRAGWVDEGPAIKRMLPRARGSANMIKKRTSHITIVVGEQNGK
jgi:large subunit ribosomal protein L22